jgi:hypothetical protein
MPGSCLFPKSGIDSGFQNRFAVLDNTVTAAKMIEDPGQEVYEVLFPAANGQPVPAVYSLEQVSANSHLRSGSNMHIGPWS